MKRLKHITANLVPEVGDEFLDEEGGVLVVAQAAQGYIYKYHKNNMQIHMDCYISNHFII